MSDSESVDPLQQQQQTLLSPTAAAAAAIGSDIDGASSPSHSSSSSSSTAATGGVDFLPEPTRFDEALIRPLTLSAGEDILLPFVEEYSKLQQALSKSHDSEARFVNKCKALAKQTRAHTHKLTALQQIALADQKRKTQLALEIERARAAYNKLQEEINSKRESLRQLRAELQNLGSSLEERSNEFLRQQRNNIAKLELEVNKFTQIRDKERGVLTRLRSKNVEHFKQLQELLAAQSRSQQEYDGLEARLLEAKALANKELRRKAEMDKNMKDLLSRVQERQSQLQSKKEQLSKANRELTEVTQALEKAQQVVEQHQQQYEQLNAQAKDANEALLDIQSSNEGLAAQLKSAQAAAEEERQATKQAKAQAETKRKQLEAMREKVRTLADETRVEEEAKSAAVEQLKLLKETMQQMQFKLNANAKAMDTCIREREVLAQNHLSKLDSIRQKEAAMRIKQATLKNSQNEHSGYLVSIRALTKILEDLKKDKQTHELDLNRRLIQKARAAEEVAQRELQIAEYQRQIVLNESKLRQQVNLLEAVRSDRNMYRKQLIEQQSEMFDYKRRFYFLSQQVQQSKSEIEEKNQFIVFEHFNLSNVRDDLEQLEQQNAATFKALAKADGVIKNQSKQIRKLSTIIADADEELRLQIQQYNAIVTEQRVLNQQLVKRNDELAQLYESLKLQNSVLTKSAAHYSEKQQLLATMEQEHAVAEKSLRQVLEDVKRFSELTQTIETVKQELTQEQLKVKALEEEAQKPINIHRWRRLMDTNTDVYNMLSKVRVLQKDLITHTAKVEEKEKSIAEQEGLYVQLRKVLARQPGSEAAEQLRLYMQQMDDKRGKLKTMRAELKMYTTKCEEYASDIKKLDHDLKLIKIAYFQKRRAQQRKLNTREAWGGVGGGDGGGAGGGGGGGGEAGDSDSDLPAILRPTKFDIPAPPQDLFPSSSSAAAASANAADESTQQQQQQQRDYSFSNQASNPYLASAAPSSSSSPAAAAGYSDPFPSAPSSSSSGAFAPPKRIRALDEDSDDDADADADGDSADDAAAAASYRRSDDSRPLSSISRTSQRPDSRLSSAAASRPDSRAGLSASAVSSAAQSARNTAHSSGNNTQRGDPNYSRFPNIAR